MTSQVKKGSLLKVEIETPTGHVVFVDVDLEVPGSVSMSSNGYPQVCLPGTGGSTLLHQYIMGIVQKVTLDNEDRGKWENG